MDRQPVRITALHFVEEIDRFEKEGLAPLPVAQSLQPRTAEDRTARLEPVPHRFDGRPSAQGETAEVEFGQLEMPYQLT